MSESSDRYLEQGTQSNLSLGDLAGEDGIRKALEAAGWTYIGVTDSGSPLFVAPDVAQADDGAE